MSDVKVPGIVRRIGFQSVNFCSGNLLFQAKKSSPGSRDLFFVALQAPSAGWHSNIDTNHFWKDGEKRCVSRY